jgi:hypothetical protein
MAVKARKKKAPPTPKEAVRSMLDNLPDDLTYEDIQYHIYVLQKIELALEDVEAGRVLSQEEVERRMEKWLGKESGLIEGGKTWREARNTSLQTLPVMPAPWFGG